MAIEQMRGCGYRRVHGLYLCGKGSVMSCDRMPYELKVCPTCGGGIKFSRGWHWLDWRKYAGEHPLECKCRCTEGVCPVCYPYTDSQPYGLLWCGEQFYTPQSFVQEALVMGVSRKIAGVPKNLKLGETWVLFAHIKACGERQEQQEDGTTKTVGIPGVFYAFRPTSLELLIWESEAKPEYTIDLLKRGITPVVIPDGDEDHDPNVKARMSADDRADVDMHNRIALLRQRLKR